VHHGIIVGMAPDGTGEGLDQINEKTVTDGSACCMHGFNLNSDIYVQYST
jgi:hypothetical protein